MKKTVMITGATGYIGNAIVNKVLEKGQYDLIVITQDKNAARKRFSDSNIRIFDYRDLKAMTEIMKEADYLIHLGFARPHRGNAEIAKSFALTSELFAQAFASGVSSIINLSSRSVYGSAEHPWTESTPVAPGSVYAQAKYGTECLLNSLEHLFQKTKSVSVRLCTVTGSGEGTMDMFVLNKFARAASRGEPIHITGGSQIFEAVDVRDAAEAILRLLEKPAEEWKSLYNLGTNKGYNIITLAEMCVAAAIKINGECRSEIFIEKQTISLDYTMDSTSFFKDMNWKPEISIEELIDSLVRYYR